MPNCIYHPAYLRLLDTLVCARKRAGLRQADVAARMGVSVSWASSIERHQIRLDLVTFCRMSAIVGLDSEALIRRLAGDLRRE